MKKAYLMAYEIELLKAGSLRRQLYTGSLIFFDSVESYRSSLERSKVHREYLPTFKELEGIEGLREVFDGSFSESSYSSNHVKVSCLDNGSDECGLLSVIMETFDHFISESGDEELNVKMRKILSRLKKVEGE